MKKILLVTVALMSLGSPALAASHASSANMQDADLTQMCKQVPENEKALSRLKKAEDKLYVAFHGTNPPPGSVSGTYSYYADWLDAAKHFCSTHKTTRQ